jgi:ubiquinone/menaquinone biosynthesis C-methylase UbiE
LQENPNMASPQTNDSVQFQTRFHQRKQAERYRNRFRPGGKHEHMHHKEVAILRALLARAGEMDLAMDLPAGTGRLTPILAENAKKVILADASDVMLEVAKEDNPTLAAEYLVTSAEKIDRPDGSVDLVFCHRFLHHINQPDLRKKIFQEMARVTRRYVIVSYYAAGFRSRIKWRLKNLVGLANRDSKPATMEQFFAEARQAGLKVAAQETLRKIPPGIFCLFEKV